MPLEQRRSADAPNSALGCYLPMTIEISTGMKTWIKTCMVLGMTLCVGFVSEAAKWETDLAAAQQTAAREHKYVLLDFTGSDWCGWCMRLKKEVFDQPEFDQYASQNLVLVEVDFPKQKALPAALSEANQALKSKYQITGFPTLVLLDPKGSEAGRFHYTPGGPSALIAQFQQNGAPGLAATAAKPSGENKATAATGTGGNSLFPWLRGGNAVNARSGAAKGEGELKLKAISGSSKRKMAMINGETLAEGESARFSIGEKTARVHCLEIHDQSVKVQVDGEDQPRELTLSITAGAGATSPPVRH